MERRSRSATCPAPTGCDRCSPRVLRGAVRGAAARRRLGATVRGAEGGGRTRARYEVGGAATLIELTLGRAEAVQAASAVATAKYNLVLQQTVMDYYTGALDPQHVSLGS